MLYAFKLGRKLRGEEPYCPEKGGKGGSSDKSAKYAAEAQKYAADLQNQQWQTIMKNLAPFAHPVWGRAIAPGNPQYADAAREAL